MVKTHRKGGGRSTDQSAGRAGALEKATATEKRASANVARVRRKLSVAIRALLTAKAGSAKEDQARRTSGAAMKDLVAAKKKLRKAQKKRRKAAARLKAKPDKAAAVQTAAASRAARTRRVHKRKPAQVRPKAPPIEQETSADTTAAAFPDPSRTDAETLTPP